jgi:hypothetical protein
VVDKVASLDMPERVVRGLRGYFTGHAARMHVFGACFPSRCCDMGLIGCFPTGFVSSRSKRIGVAAPVTCILGVARAEGWALVLLQHEDVIYSSIMVLKHGKVRSSFGAHHEATVVSQRSYVSTTAWAAGQLWLSCMLCWDQSDTAVPAA